MIRAIKPNTTTLHTHSHTHAITAMCLAVITLLLLSIHTQTHYCHHSVGSKQTPPSFFSPSLQLQVKPVELLCFYFSITSCTRSFSSTQRWKEMQENNNSNMKATAITVLHITISVVFLIISTLREGAAIQIWCCSCSFQIFSGGRRKRYDMNRTWAAQSRRAAGNKGTGRSTALISNQVDVDGFIYSLINFFPISP